MVTVVTVQKLQIFEKINLLTGAIGNINYINNVMLVRSSSDMEWLKGHDLLLMDYNVLKEMMDSQLIDFQSLVARSVAAIGVREGGVEASEYQSIVELAKQAQLPLFDIPDDMILDEIAFSVSQQILTVREIRMNLEYFTQRLVNADEKKAQYLYDQSVFAKKHPDAMQVLPVLFESEYLDEHQDDVFRKEVEFEMMRFIRMLKENNKISHYLQIKNYHSYCFFLFFNNEKEDEEIRQKMMEEIHQFISGFDVQERFKDIKMICGIGSVQKDNINFKKGLDESEAANQIGSALINREAEQVFFYEKVILFDLLSLDEDIYADYFQGYLDRHLNTKEMLDTLMCYFKAEENISEASRLLYVHPNTIRYRLDKIKQETGLDINNMLSKTILYLYCIHKNLSDKKD